MIALDRHAPVSLISAARGSTIFILAIVVVVATRPSVGGAAAVVLVVAAALLPRRVVALTRRRIAAAATKGSRLRVDRRGSSRTAVATVLATTGPPTATMGLLGRPACGAAARTEVAHKQQHITAEAETE
jgi:hypothetical protein